MPLNPSAEVLALADVTARYLHDRYAFLTECCYTEDEVAQTDDRVRLIPEKEVMLYALVKGIEFHNAECPYSVRALRGSFRDIVDALEEKTPGTRHSIMNSYESIKDLLLEKYPPIKLNSCPSCGEPTSQKLCKTCLLKKRILQ